MALYYVKSVIFLFFDIFKKHETKCWASQDNKYNSMLQEGLNVEEMENEEKEMQLSR